MTLTHGTASAYTNGACRCGECRRAWAAYYKGRGYARRKREAFVAAGLTTKGTERKVNA